MLLSAFLLNLPRSKYHIHNACPFSEASLAFCILHATGWHNVKNSRKTVKFSYSFDLKHLIVRMFPCKLPLAVIEAPHKLYNGLGIHLYT